MKTQDEIVAHITDEKDIFGFTAEVLVPYLDFEHAKFWLTKDTTALDWAGEDLPKQERPDIIEAIREYLEFAVGKAIDHRGLSSGRSISKLKAWVWLLDDANYTAINWGAYANYGAPILKTIAERLELTVDGLDDPGFLRMANGRACHDGCDNGCGE